MVTGSIWERTLGILKRIFRQTLFIDTMFFSDENDNRSVRNSFWYFQFAFLNLTFASKKDGSGFESKLKQLQLAVYLMLKDSPGTTRQQNSVVNLLAEISKECKMGAFY